MCLAIPGKIIEITKGEPMDRTGKVDFGGIVKEVHLGYVPEAQIGDYVNIHAGFAIAVLQEAEAAEILQIYTDMNKYTGMRDGLQR